jgi:hypothetical protein
MKKPRSFLRVAAECVVFFGGIYFFILGGWENLPLFDRISGPSRFRQFVAAPIPSCVHSIRKGYSGFPQGRITTYFRYDGTLESCRFLGGWIPTQVAPELGFGAENPWTKAFRKHARDEIYLLIREGTNEGLLFIP